MQDKVLLEVVDRVAELPQRQSHGLAAQKFNS